ncbi:MAG TPA: glycoside hydrolase family 28 protein [Polyangiaceae bacterium]|nr:glycoside hydrolase family 28 protein [Polyangiaceae bacterium]
MNTALRSLARAKLWLLLFALTTACSPSATGSAPAPSAPPAAAPAKGALDTGLEPIQPVSAPFPVPAFVRPSIPARSFDIKAFGAVADGQTKNTAAFARAIEAASQAGGGTVLVPEGRWLTGPIHLRSNIELRLSKGAELLFSQDFADYLPPVFTRWEGLEVYNYSPLVYARDCQNVAITGEGTLNGQGAAWWPWKKTQQATAARLYELATAGVPPEQRVLAAEGGLRPSFIQTVGCKNVLVEGVTIQNGPMWTIHPVYSENVIVRRVTVRTEGPNNDGLNPDSSRNVLVEDSFFSTGDDCIVIKSGLNEDGWRVGKPSENIIVRRIHGERGHGGVVIGSEMSGGVRNVSVTDSEFIGTDRGLRIKSMRGRGGVVENVYYENVRHRDIGMMVVEMTTAYASSTLVPKTDKPPIFRNIFVKNVTAEGAKSAAEISGLSEVPIENLSFEQVRIASEAGFHCTDCRGLRLRDVQITPRSGPPFKLVNTSRASLSQSCSADVKPCIALEGERSGEVVSDGVAIAVQPASR